VTASDEVQSRSSEMGVEEGRILPSAKPVLRLIAQRAALDEEELAH
jgi:hypothetical protein